MKIYSNNFSEIIVEKYSHLPNWGRMSDSDALAIFKGPCGDTMEIYLKIRNNIITKASFFTDGCKSAAACGSKLTTIVINNSIIDTRRIKAKDLLEALDGLPPEEEHCALLAVNTLHKALNNFKKKFNEDSSQ